MKLSTCGDLAGAELAYGWGDGVCGGGDGVCGVGELIAPHANC